MSNSGAIWAVTDSIRATLTREAGLTVVAESLDKLTGTESDERLNLYLYQVLPNAYRRNMDIPWKVKPGEAARAPLALDLHYLLIARGARPEDAQLNLAKGMLALHDNPVIDPIDTTTALFERARITMQSLSLDDMEKLWAGASNPRQLSVAYEVSVVLIESQQPVRSPLPVLTRGTGQDSIVVDLKSYPAIERVEIGEREFDKWLRSGGKPGRSAAQIDDKIFLYGQSLVGASSAVIQSFLHPRAPRDEIKVPISGINERGGLIVDLSALDDAQKPPAGPCSIALEIADETAKRIDITNTVPFSLAPKLDPIPLGTKVTIGNSIVVRFQPPLVERQQVALIVGGDRFTAEPESAVGATSLSFPLQKILPGVYPVRLRVDGIDSVVFDLNAGPSNPASPYINLVEVEE